MFMQRLGRDAACGTERNSVRRMLLKATADYVEQ